MIPFGGMVEAMTRRCVRRGQSLDSTYRAIRGLWTRWHPAEFRLVDAINLASAVYALASKHTRERG